MKSRSIAIAAAALSAVMLAFGWIYLKASTSSSELTAWPFFHSITGIAPGTHRWDIDIYKPRSIEIPRSILFVRKHDGKLGAWYFQRLTGYPAAPFDNLLPAGTKCDSLDISDADEQIRCDYTDTTRNTKLVMTWDWDGKSLGVLAPDLKPVPGRQIGNSFVLHPEAIDSELMLPSLVQPKD